MTSSELGYTPWSSLATLVEVARNAGMAESLQSNQPGFPLHLSDLWQQTSEMMKLLQSPVSTSQDDPNAGAHFTFRLSSDADLLSSTGERPPAC